MQTARKKLGAHSPAKGRTMTQPRVMVTLFPNIPNDGNYVAKTITPDEAGQLLAVAIDDRRASLHITRRNLANLLERLSERHIGSQYLRATTLPELRMEIADVMLCLKIRASGRRKIDQDKNAEFAANDFDFVCIERAA